MLDSNYGFTRTFPGTSFEKARERITSALQKEGFGILTEIDVKATLKKKIDVDFRPYVILGACNPSIAHKALLAEPAIGLLLPCNVVVAEDDDGTTVVSIIKPEKMFQVVDNAGMQPLVDEVTKKLTSALESA
ncbi:MAG: DUF302 domain-containing protein [Myxococcota bacterium]